MRLPASTYSARISAARAGVAGTRAPRRSGGIPARRASPSRSSATSRTGAAIVRTIVPGSRPISSQYRSRSSVLWRSTSIPSGNQWA